MASEMLERSLISSNSQRHELLAATYAWHRELICVLPPSSIQQLQQIKCLGLASSNSHDVLPCG